MHTHARDAVASVEQRIVDVCEQAGADVFLHVREIGEPTGVDVGADTAVAVASVVKILVVLAFARAVADGAVAATDRVLVPASLRFGGAGTAGCTDPVELSLRDLALFMMSVSDNAATDVVADRVGLAAINRIADDLGLRHTRMVADMHTLYREVVAELELEDVHDLDAELRSAGERVRGLTLIDPARTNRSTPREVGSLLEAIWTDRAGPPGACAMVRRLMSQQVCTHRLAGGFPDEVTVASKTGSVPTVRNDAGVITYPDGRRYVAAVFTRARALDDRSPDIDAAIGTCARLAVEALRTRAPRGSRRPSTPRPEPVEDA